MFVDLVFRSGSINYSVELIYGRHRKKIYGSVENDVGVRCLPGFQAIVSGLRAIKPKFRKEVTVRISGNSEYVLNSVFGCDDELASRAVRWSMCSFNGMIKAERR